MVTVAITGIQWIANRQINKQTFFFINDICKYDGHENEKKGKKKYKSEQADDDVLIKINYKKPRLEKNLLINDLLFIVLSIYTSKEHWELSTELYHLSETQT